MDNLVGSGPPQKKKNLSHWNKMISDDNAFEDYPSIMAEDLDVQTKPSFKLSNSDIDVSVLKTAAVEATTVSESSPETE